MAFNAEANGQWRMCLPFASALKSAKPVANASLCQTQSTTGKNGVKKVLCATSIPGLHLPHQQAEACHALPLLLIKDGLGSNIGLNIN